ncbi:hypothetical protein QTP99_05845 [Caldanaerobacter subterraneus KAk]
MINSIEESYYRINYLAEEPTHEEYYLKSPIKEKSQLARRQHCLDY